MRLALVGLGSGGGPSDLPFIDTPGQVRVQSPRQERQMTTATCDPWGDRQKPFLQKNPSDATNKGRIASPNAVTNTGSRKHAVFCARSSSACLLQQRAGSKVTSPIHHRK